VKRNIPIYACNKNEKHAKNLLACILISLLFYAAYFSDQQFSYLDLYRDIADGSILSDKK